MNLSERDNKAIDEFVKRLKDIFGARLKRLLVFGSRTRGIADPLADIDVLVIVTDLTYREEYRIWDIAGDVSLDYDVIFSVAGYDEHDFYRRDELPFIQALIQEGVEYEIQ